MLQGQTVTILSGYKLERLQGQTVTNSNVTATARHRRHLTTKQRRIIEALDDDYLAAIDLKTYQYRFAA